MPTRPRLSRLVLFSMLALVIGGSAIASARYVQPAPAQEGRYGAVRGDELIGFKVLPNRVVKAFFFNTLMECHNSDTGENYVRAFDARNIGGGKVSFNGHWEHEYSAESGLRQGNGLIEISFTRGRGVFASVSVVVPGEAGAFESCNGFLDLKMRRGPLS